VGRPLKTDNVCQDRLGYTVWVTSDIRVPESNHRPPQRFQPPRPPHIATRPNMLAPIELHRQPNLTTRQIDNKPLHHQLPRKPWPKIRDLVPDRDLRVGRIVAKLPSAPRHIGRDTGHLSRLRSDDAEGNPLPAPTFQAGGQRISSSTPPPSLSLRPPRCKAKQAHASGPSSPTPTATSPKSAHR